MSALQSILDSYRRASATEREKGTYFEELILCYLRNEATYRDLYSDVWSYADWAKLNGLDAREWLTWWGPSKSERHVGYVTRRLENDPEAETDSARRAAHSVTGKTDTHHERKPCFRNRVAALFGSSSARRLIKICKIKVFNCSEVP